ncbi:mannosyltransferase [Dispira parvispora]|uniref:Mannosyltransferase n=1 Tax=Dispira parvispora TaxID=1520584 RepID=A0A9W8AXU5_9FUNG|nr:mannosyltransferase [Dispira parvispora]
MSSSSSLRRRAKTPPVANSNKSPSHHSNKIKNVSPSIIGYVPSFRVAFGLLVCLRVLSALTVPSQDCDEVFNYWEPLHYLQFGRGFQTWEYSPEFGIRSWAYIGLHAIVSKIFYTIPDIISKAQVFYALRITLAIVCAACEARFYRSIVRYVNPCIGRYTLVALLGSAGMMHSSSALLPSSFAMYAAMLASPYMLQAPSPASGKRIYYGIFWIALGALLGWPFSAAVGLPFVAEELFVGGILAVPRRDHVYRGSQVKPNYAKGSKGPRVSKPRWWVTCFFRLCIAASLGLTILVPLLLVDRWFYQRWMVVPWNIIRYNIMSKDSGPELYGTQPWHYYIVNGLLNFNVVFILALLTLPLLILLRICGTLENSTWAVGAANRLSSTRISSYTLMAFKVAPFYLMLGIFNSQPHKEERFLYIVYPWICFAAAVTLHLARVQMGKIAHCLSLSRVTSLIPLATAATLSLYVIISFLRVGSLVYHYQAPLTVHREFFSLAQENIAATSVNQTITSPLVCTAKEWYRFPSHYFIPHPYRVGFLRSLFRGQLPRYFAEPNDLSPSRTYSDQLPVTAWPPTGTYIIPQGFNDKNQEETDSYVELADCDYIVDYYSPKQPASHQEPAFVLDTKHWRRSVCRPFLDAQNTHPLFRAFYIPPFLRAPLLTSVQFLQSILRGRTAAKALHPSVDDVYTWGEYCILERVKRVK